MMNDRNRLSSLETNLLTCWMEMEQPGKRRGRRPFMKETEKVGTTAQEAENSLKDQEDCPRVEESTCYLFGKLSPKAREVEFPVIKYYFIKAPHDDMQSACNDGVTFPSLQLPVLSFSWLFWF